LIERDEKMTAVHRLNGRRSAGFTLIEVILAIVIALAILVVVLHFYQQATNLREQVIAETEKVGAARLLMDRITGELRSALPEWSLAPAFIGSSNTIQFIKADVPAFTSWSGAALGRANLPNTDLRRIQYRLLSSEGTNIAGVLRSEEALLVQRRLSVADEPGQTNDMASAASAPILEEIRFLQFRYWSGTNWQDSWNESGCPPGVEISLGSDPVTNGMDLAEYPGELFRRVVYLAANALPTAAETTPRSSTAAPEAEGTP
jgi:type II secretory pathway pseudopilin PulG